MNRQTKRYLQRQGQLGADGTPETAQRRPPAARAPTRPDPSKGNRIQRTQQFVHEVNVELRKVAWPTRAETINYSSVVLITLVVLILLIFLLDTGFAKASLFLFK